MKLLLKMGKQSDIFQSAYANFSRRCLRPNPEILSAKSDYIEIRDMFVPVSYTHLDVYKRQGKYWLPWEFKSFVAVFTEIPWLEVIYSPPTKSSLNARKEASHIGIVFLSFGVRVLIPWAACIRAIASRYKAELYLTSLPASLTTCLPSYFSRATSAFATVSYTHLDVYKRQV